jgi:serine/threonine protein kinase
MEAAASHPSRDDLSAFGLGELDGARAEAIVRHLEGCVACREQVEKPSPALPVAPLPDGDRPAEVGKTDIPETRSDTDLTPGTPLVAADVPQGLADHPRYRILRLLGKGGMGAVYLAEHKVLGRPRALKVVAAGIVADPKGVERFRREVQAAARLDHPSIVRAFDAEEGGETYFLVMEYVEGIDLAGLLRKQGPLSVAHACHFVRQAALGLEHAREQGMVHRDIKPQNLMLARKNVVKILDFGLAKVVSEAATEVRCPTRDGAVMGTPDYMAPEQWEDARSADIRADVYSLGCTLYALLTGAPPFHEPAGLVQKMAAHVRAAARPLCEVRPDVPAGLSALVQRMLAKAPAERPQTPGEVAAALLPFVTASNPSVTASKPQPAPARPAEPKGDEGEAIAPPPRPRPRSGAAVRCSEDASRSRA